MKTSDRLAPTIRGVAFDLDGLLFNTEDVFNMSGTELLRRRGKLMTHEIRVNMMGRRAAEAFEFLINKLELTETMEELITESELIFYEYLDIHLAPMPGLYELLDHIEKCGLPKGVASSSRRPYIENILNRFELLPRFDFILSGDDVTKGKPDPAIYLMAAEKLEVDPSEMIVFEDSEAGTKSAAAAGAYAVSIPHDHSRHHDFSQADYIAASLHDPIVLSLLKPLQPKEVH